MASRFADALRKAYPGSSADPDARDVWCSSELGWSGWRALQERVESSIGEGRARHLTSMGAWFGAYLPILLEPSSVRVKGSKTPLDVASLPELIRELEEFGASAGLPVDDVGLLSLAAKYDDDDFCEDDKDIQTYAQLLLGAHLARSRRQPLWVIK